MDSKSPHEVDQTPSEFKIEIKTKTFQFLKSSNSGGSSMFIAEAEEDIFKNSSDHILIPSSSKVGLFDNKQDLNKV
jgi:hypothetical protein